MGVLALGSGGAEGNARIVLRKDDLMVDMLGLGLYGERKPDREMSFRGCKRRKGSPH